MENGLATSVMAKRWSGDGVRLCGTPGCRLPDFHAGPCSNAASLGRRREHNIKLPYNEKAAQQLLRGEAVPMLFRDSLDSCSEAPVAPSHERLASSALGSRSSISLLRTDVSASARCFWDD